MGKPTKLPAQLGVVPSVIPGIGGYLGGLLGGIGQSIGDAQQRAMAQQQLAQQSLQGQLAQANELLQGYQPIVTQADLKALQGVIYGGRPSLAQQQAEFAARHPHGPLPYDRIGEPERRGPPLTIDQYEAAYERWLTTCTDARTFEEWLARAPAVGLVTERRRWWPDVPLERFGQAIGRLAELMDFEVLGAVTTVGILVYLLLRLL